MLDPKTNKLGFLLGLLLLAAPLANSEEPFQGSIVMRDTSNPGQTRPVEAWLVPIRLLEKPWTQWTQEEKGQVPRERVDEFYRTVEEVRAYGASGQCAPGEAIPAISKKMVMAPDWRISISEAAGTAEVGLDRGGSRNRACVGCVFPPNGDLGPSESPAGRPFAGPHQRRSGSYVPAILGHRDDPRSNSMQLPWNSSAHVRQLGTHRHGTRQPNYAFARANCRWQ